MTDSIPAHGIPATPETVEAIDIAQAHLDASTRLVAAGDGAGYCVHAQLPFVFRTAEGLEVAETKADLIADVQRVHDWLTSKGVTDFHRIARSARYLDDDTIEGFYTSYALRDALQIVAPYASRMILRRVEATWKVSFSEHELEDGLYPGCDAHARPGHFEGDWARAPEAPTRSPAEALEIYGAHLAGIADAVDRDRFDLFLGHYELPYRMHHDGGDDLAVDEAATRWRYDLLRRTMAEVGADRIALSVGSAHFLADDRILGYHESSLTAGAEPRFGPIRSRMILTERDGAWRVNSITNALATSGFVRGELVLSANIPTLREIDRRTKT